MEVAKSTKQESYDFSRGRFKKVNSALDILLTDKENYARLKKEIHDLVELGRESAKEILKLICKKA